MPDQPDDPIHYDMKIPPEPQDAPLNKQKETREGQEQRGSDEVTEESNRRNEDSGSRDGKKAQPARDR